MKRLTLVVVLLAAVVAAARAPADDWKGQPIKRHVVAQVIDCMRKRMSSDRVISYNDAAKLCKVEVNRRLENISSAPLVAADNPAR
jgi:hypothetical protein